jgi:hypothetical protein
LTRLEHNEHKFVERCDGDTDGAVINLRFDSSSSHGRLKRAAAKKRLPFIIDLESWRLPFLAGPEDESFGSDAHTALAASVPLPLGPSVFQDQGHLEAMTRVAVQAQVGALYTFAPYFLVASLEILGSISTCVRSSRCNGSLLGNISQLGFTSALMR